ncbi:MAG: glycosyltransferase [Myxococcota bacterium]
MRIVMSEPLRFRDDVRVGSHHYAAGFLRAGHELFWLGAPFHLLGALRGLAGAERHEFAAESLRRGPTAIGAASYAYHPVTLLPYRDRPFLRSRFVLTRTLDYCVPSLARTLQRLGFDRPELLWLSQSPSSAALARLVRPAMTAYRLSDRYESFGKSRALYAQLERELLGRADVIFVSARDLLDDLGVDLRRKAHYVPNGCDVAHFAPAGRALPGLLASIPAPRVIYAGTLGPWVDFDLIAEAARRLPHVSFVLVGPALVPASMLPLRDNIHWLGSVPYDAMPSLFEHSAIGLIPFRRSPLTESTNPIKLYEYLAAGLAVVTTPLRETVSLAAPVAYAEDSAAMVAAIEAELSKPGDPQPRVGFAQQHDWSVRFATVARACGLEG